MKVAVKLMCALALALLWAGTQALADVPTEMSVQGRLTNGAGAPVAAGIKLFTFKIYDAPAGGTEIWPAGPGETQALATDANGLWNAGVGTLIPLTEAVFQYPVRWLEVTVNDGVNPIETLPRIELRTNPYTYRAATSQHADSLGSSTYTDLVDQFVDEVGDTMSGQLRIAWDHSTGQSNLAIRNISNAYGPTWSVGSGTWGATVDVNSDNGFWNIGVGGAAQGDGTTNYGLFGVARGSGSGNYAVWGEAAGVGSNNVAGHFGGKLEVINIDGDAGVNLPTDAISSAEILDEPGLTNAEAGINVPVGAGVMTDLVTVTITTPSTGYIYLVGTTAIETNGNVGGGWNYIQIDTTAGGGFSVPARVVIAGFATYPNAGFIDWSLSTQKTYSKPAGTYTFRLEAMETGSGTSVAHNPTLTAIFLPTSYGAVVALASAAEASEFEVSKPLGSQAGLAGGSAAVDASAVYEVDLRELELKAARSEAEAERARRELAEARIRSMTAGPTSAAEGE